MTRTPLPLSTPAAEGVDGAGIGRFVDALEADPRIDPHALIILRHGRVVARCAWSPYRTDRIQLLYSLSKTFTATALGFAVAEGLVGLDDRLVEHFPEFADEIRTPRSRAIRIRDVAAMASGHATDQWSAALAGDPAEPVRGFLLREPEFDPGTRFAYNQPATYAVAAVVQRAACTTLAEYLRPRLFDPIGIGPVFWQQYPPGRDLGFSGLHASCEDIARLGLLHLQDGRWDGEQVLPAGWAQEVRTRRVATTPAETNPDWAQGYGYQVWMSRHGYRGDGAFGQFCLILPDQDAVIAVTETTEAMQDVLDLVWQHLVPAFHDTPRPGHGDVELARRLAHLELPPATGAPEPAETSGWKATFMASSTGAASLFDQASLARTGDSWTLTLADGPRRARLPIGHPGWTLAEETEQATALAVSGGWADDSTLRLDLLLLQTPHRARLELSRDTHTLRAELLPPVLGPVPPWTVLQLGSPPRPHGGPADSPA